MAIALAISYGVGAPATAYLEFSRQLFSQRFDVPSVLIYAVALAQFICAGGVLVRRYASWAAGVLTVTTVGAIVSHIRIGSPATSIAAVVYTGVQVWFAIAGRRSATR